MASSSPSDYPSIYLIGSFHGFRDEIIRRLPQFSFADPRKHRQSSAAKMVIDDLTEAATNQLSLAVFPKGKSYGVMSFSEIGVAYKHGNHLIIIDGNQQEPILKELADETFTTLDDALNYLNNKKSFSTHRRERPLIYPPERKEPLELRNVLVTGTFNKNLEQALHEAQRRRPELSIDLTTPDKAFSQFKDLHNYDFLVAYFPREDDWNRTACLFMGGAYAHDLPILILDEHDWKYPPLQAIARRQGSLKGLADYLSEVDDQLIGKEAVNMYSFFQREKNSYNKKK